MFYTSVFQPIIFAFGIFLVGLVELKGLVDDGVEPF